MVFALFVPCAFPHQLLQTYQIWHDNLSFGEWACEGQPAPKLRWNPEGIPVVLVPGDPSLIGMDSYDLT